jgi:hypothetical protein
MLTLLGIVTAILFYLLLAPIRIEINTRLNIYGARFHRLARVRFFSTPESMYMEWHVLGWHKSIDLLAISPQKAKRKENTESKKSGTMSAHKFIAVLKTFKISACHIVLDTGDMALNGILYPWLLGMGRLVNGDVRINFNNENSILLEIENNLLRLFWAYLIH